MQITEQFTRQHHEMISLCEQLWECAIEEHIRQDARFVHTLQQSLYTIVNLHHRVEDFAFYPMLHEHKDERVRVKSLELKARFHGCEETHRHYQQTYPTAKSIQSNAAQYVSDTHHIINVIRNRINMEERELYSLLRQEHTAQ